MRNQSGFTMIELVVVIVILGILAAIAIPKFVDMSTEARQAATDGVAAAVASAGAVNYAASLAKGQVAGTAFSAASATPGGEITDVYVSDGTGGCTDTVAGNLVPDTAFGTDYVVSGANFAATDLVGDTVTCTVTNQEDTSITSTFVLYGTK